MNWKKFLLQLAAMVTGALAAALGTVVGKQGE